MEGWIAAVTFVVRMILLVRFLAHRDKLGHWDEERYGQNMPQRGLQFRPLEVRPSRPSTEPRCDHGTKGEPLGGSARPLWDETGWTSSTGIEVPSCPGNVGRPRCARLSTEGRRSGGNLIVFVQLADVDGDSHDDIAADDHQT